MDSGPSVVAYRRPAEEMQPGDRALRHPAGAPQALLRLAAFARQAGEDVPPPQGRAIGGGVVRLVGVQLVGPSARAAPLAAQRRPSPPGWGGR
jgi:hypothetical protein